MKPVEAYTLIGSVAAGLVSWAIGKLFDSVNWLPWVVLPLAAMILLLTGALRYNAWQRSKRRDALPGLGVHMIIRVADIQERRRRYFFDFCCNGKQGMAFYLSSSDRFVFSVWDIDGEPYSIELPSGNLGLPIAKFSLFSLEASSDKQRTYLRVSLNGQSVAFRELGFPIDLGEVQPNSGSIGSDRTGKNNAAFDISEIIINKLALDDADMEQMTRHMTEKYGYLG